MAVEMKKANDEGGSGVVRIGLEKKVDKCPKMSLEDRIRWEIKKLPQKDRVAAENFIPSLLQTIDQARTDKEKLIKLLVEWKGILKESRRYIRTITWIADSIGYSKKQVRRWIAEAETATDEAKMTPAHQSQSGPPASTEKETPLSKHEMRTLRSLRTLDKMCSDGNVTRRVKKERLADLIAVLAHDFWDIREPFTLDIKPREGAFTPDGSRTKKMGLVELLRMVADDAATVPF